MLDSVDDILIDKMTKFKNNVINGKVSMLGFYELDVWDCVQSVDVFGRKTLLDCFLTMIIRKHRVSDIEDVRVSSVDSFVPLFEVILLIFRKRNLLVHLVDNGSLDQLGFCSSSLFFKELLVCNFFVY